MKGETVGVECGLKVLPLPLPNQYPHHYKNTFIAVITCSAIDFPQVSLFRHINWVVDFLPTITPSLGVTIIGAKTPLTNKESSGDGLFERIKSHQSTLGLLMLAFVSISIVVLNNRGAICN